jgi:hypothetical protein
MEDSITVPPFVPGHESTTSMTNPEIRKAIASRVFEKLRGAGIRIDTDPILQPLIQRWINGEMRMSDIAAQYQDLLRSRLLERRNARLETGVPLQHPGPNIEETCEHELMEVVGRLLSADEPPVAVIPEF